MGDWVEILIIVTMSAFALIGLSVWYRHQQPSAEFENKTYGDPPKDAVQAIQIERPLMHLPILDAEQLLSRTSANGLITEIQSRFGFAPENFTNDVLPVVRAIAQYVQLLPASESHHHAGPGGLLIHLLEVARNALHFRQGYKLPLGETTENQAKLAARWTYGIFIAALLHDIGKPLSDVIITLYEADEVDSGKQWNGLAGSMNQTSAAFYRVDFPDQSQRNYARHQKLPVILLRDFVPSATLHWLSEDSRLLQELMDYLGNDVDESEGGVIGKIISKADSLSVKSNLQSGMRTRFATAKVVPLISRLTMALQKMLEEGGQLPLNRPGAAGFVSDGSIWFVAGRVADSCRNYLAANEIRRPGAGIPEDNVRLFDVWQEHGFIDENSKGGAIWVIRVEFESWGGNLRVLRFPLNKLYSDPEQYPEPCSGKVLILNDGFTDIESLAGEDGKAEITNAPQGSPTDGLSNFQSHNERNDFSIANIEDQTQILPQLNADEIALGRISSTEKKADKSIDSSDGPPMLAPSSDDYLDESDGAHLALMDEKKSQGQKIPTEPTSPVQIPTRTQKTRELRSNAGAPIPTERVQKFMAWIQQSVANNTLEFNESHAMVHFVPEGILLISPRIIKHYVAHLGPSGTGGDASHDDKAWRKFQNEFQKSGYPVKSSDSSFIHVYATSTIGSGTLKAYLIPSPERLFSNTPEINPYIIPKQLPHQPTTT